MVAAGAQSLVRKRLSLHQKGRIVSQTPFSGFVGERVQLAYSAASVRGVFSLLRPRDRRLQRIA